MCLIFFQHNGDILKETEEILELYYKALDEINDSNERTHFATKMLAKMAKILTMIEDEEPPRKPLPRKVVLEIEPTVITQIKREKFLLYANYQNLQTGLFDENGAWKHFEEDRTGALINLEPNVFQFCNIANEIFLSPKYEFSRMSELIFNLLELEFDEEAQLIQEALKALEEGSEYEFCGKIRSTLEKIIVKAIIKVGEENRKSIFNNLHTLKKKKFIEKKLVQVIASNYSYGSQFIHQEKSTNLNDVKLFVDQTLLHIEKILEKIKDL